MKQFLTGFFLCTSLVSSSALAAEVSLTGAAWAGTVRLKAGSYQLEVKGGKAQFLVGKIEVASVPASVELAAQDYRDTVVETAGGRIAAISLGHSSIRVLLDTTAELPEPVATASVEPVAAAAPVVADSAVAQARRSISLAAPLHLGDKVLKAGEYRMEIKSNTLSFRQGATVLAEVPVEIELSTEEFPATQLETMASHLTGVRIGSTGMHATVQGGAEAGAAAVAESKAQAAATQAAEERKAQQAKAAELAEAAKSSTEISASVDFPETVWAGNTKLTPGKYRLDVADGKLTITQGHTVVAQEAARLETGSRKIVDTQIEATRGNLVAIQLGGTTRRIVFGENQPTKAAPVQTAAQQPVVAERQPEPVAPVKSALTILDLAATLYAGQAPLPPGRYELDLKDGILSFRTADYEVARVPASKSTSGERYDMTFVETAGNQLMAIRVGGSNTRIVIAPTSVIIANTGK